MGARARARSRAAASVSGIEVQQIRPLPTRIEGPKPFRDAALVHVLTVDEAACILVD